MVPLGEGPPTKEQLLVHYPAKFTWHQLKIFVNSGDLGLVNRDKKLQKRYDEWCKLIIEEHGSMVQYLLNYRLRWGQPDTLTLFKSEVEDDGCWYSPTAGGGQIPRACIDNPPYFSVDTPPEYYCIIQNDWPYSVPADVEHTVVWTKAPIYHPELVDEGIQHRISQDGIWGFTGLRGPPPSPSELPSCLPALAEWGITLENMTVSTKGTETEEAAVQKAGSKVAEFVRKRWREDIWETAWFVNPPRLQSIPNLAHLHVFARGNSGIGHELVKLLSEKGNKVYLGARNAKSGNEAVATLASQGFSDIQFLQLDVTDTTSIEAARDIVAQRDGHLDVLVNNAGIGELSQPQLATDPIINEALRATMETNLFGLVQTTVTLLPLLRKSHNGVILNVSSDMASNTLQAGPNAIMTHATAYNVSKAAANSYTIHLANELKKDGSGIKVNAVTPGFTSTKLNAFGAGGKTTKAGAETLLPWALLEKDGPTGLFIDQNGQECPW